VIELNKEITEEKLNNYFKRTEEAKHPIQKAGIV
jgi:hypothetical protein